MNAPLPQTTALTRWVVRGDQEAFRELVAAYSPLVRAVCRRILPRQRARPRPLSPASSRRTHRNEHPARRAARPIPLRIEAEEGRRLAESDLYRPPCDAREPRGQLHRELRVEVAVRADNRHEVRPLGRLERTTGRCFA